VTSSVDVGDLSSGNVDQITARLNDPKTVQLVAAATGMPQAEARTTLSGITQRVESARNDPAQAIAEARKGAEEIASKVTARAERAAAEAQRYASATMWSTLLALVAAVGGAMSGRKQVANRLADVATSSTVR
jgi:F0F1-type ATP synthase membrane subunit b/b'